MKYLSLLLFPLFISCNQKNELERANALKASSIELINSQSYYAGIDSAKTALSIYLKEENEVGQAETYFHLARASAMSGDFGQSKDYGLKGASLAKKLNDLSLEYKINNILSWSYFSLGMGFEETINHQKRQLFVVNQLENDAAKAQVYNNYGYDATVSGLVNLDSAITYMKWANDYYAKEEKTHGRWYTLMNLCWQYRLKNDLETAKAYGLHSLSQAKADSNRHAIIEAATNLSETLLAQENTEEASQRLMSVVELAKQEVDRDKYVFDIYYAHYLGEAGELSDAIEKLRASIEFLKDGEIFYEMLARAYLAKYTFQDNRMDLVLEQLETFENPRATYYSMESKVIASIVKAEMEMNADELEELIQKCEEINASYLSEKLVQAKNRIANNK